MKALSLTQPWASAVALGIKQWETRSWPTSFRGQFGVHAAKGFPGYAKQFANDEHFMCRMPDISELPLGFILCVAELTECRRTEDVVKELSDIERLYGDYSPGRYAFKLDNIHRLAAPVFHRGALGFWHVAWDETNEILRMLRNGDSNG